MTLIERQQALDQIERLRKTKEELKAEKAKIDNQLIEIDLLILGIRQNMPKEEIEEIPKAPRAKPQKREMTAEELKAEIARMTKELEAKEAEMQQ